MTILESLAERFPDQGVVQIPLAAASQHTRSHLYQSLGTTLASLHLDNEAADAMTESARAWQDAEHQSQ